MPVKHKDFILFQPFRSDDLLSVMINRCNRNELNINRMYYSGKGEHEGIIINSQASEYIPKSQSDFEIPMICQLTNENSKISWTESRKLMFYFEQDLSNEKRLETAQDFYHSLLHPEIFQKDYCGFIIAMIKILQHGYPQILELQCIFETIDKYDSDLINKLLKHMQECYPPKQTVDDISKNINLSPNDVMTGLKTSMLRGLVDQIGDFYVLKGENAIDEEVTDKIMSALDNSAPIGLSSSKISDLTSCPLSQVKNILSALTNSNKIEYDGQIYYSRSSSANEKIDAILELLESVNPNGIFRSEISKNFNYDITNPLEYLLQQGYISEKNGQLYIRRLEDDEIDLVYSAIKESQGMSIAKIIKKTNFTSIVVLSAVNVLEDGEYIKSKDDKYYTTERYFNEITIEEIPHQVVVRVYDSLKEDDKNGMTPVALAKLADIDEEYSTVILNHLEDAELISSVNGLYHKITISDHDRSSVLSVLQKDHPKGTKISEMAKNCQQFNEKKLWFILRDLIAAKKVKNVGDLYYMIPTSTETRCTDKDIGKILKFLEETSPSGLSVKDITSKSELSESVVQTALSNLTHRCFIVKRGDEYFSRNFENDCDLIINSLSEAHPSGMVLSEICECVGIKSQVLVKEILRYLIDSQKSIELYGKLYFYVSPKSDPLSFKLVVKILAENYPNGLTLEEIKNTDSCKLVTKQDMNNLIKEKSVYEKNGLFYYNHQFSLSENDYDQVLQILEAAYPNSVNLSNICKESKMSEENILIIIKDLMEKSQVTEVDKGIFIRTVNINKEKIMNESDIALEKRPITSSMEPTIAIITSDYSIKMCADLMLTNTTSYFKYKIGDSSVYTLGNIGNKRIVVTKFSHGYSRSLAISAGNATTRLLGTFPKIEHAIILGLGGGVVDTSDVSRHVRLGDVVVSFAEKFSSIYFMETSSEIKESTILYEQKEWKCYDKQLHSIVEQIYEKVSDLPLFPWEDYITQAQEVLFNELPSQDFHRPASMTDQVSHMCQESLLPGHLEGRPRMCLGKIGAGRHLHKSENLKENFVKKSGVIAFNAEYDQVIESINGNCVDSFMFIHGISDYTDGTENALWQSYAALSSAAVLKFIIENI